MARAISFSLPVAMGFEQVYIPPLNNLDALPPYTETTEGGGRIVIQMPRATITQYNLLIAEIDNRGVIKREYVNVWRSWERPIVPERGKTEISAGANSAIKYGSTSYPYGGIEDHALYIVNDDGTTIPNRSWFMENVTYAKKVFTFTGDFAGEYEDVATARNNYPETLYAPSRAGYIFVGWKSPTGKIVKAGEAVEDDLIDYLNITLTAVWKSEDLLNTVTFYKKLPFVKYSENVNYFETEEERETFMADYRIAKINLVTPFYEGQGKFYVSVENESLSEVLSANYALVALKEKYYFLYVDSVKVVQPNGDNETNTLEVAFTVDEWQTNFFKVIIGGTEDGKIELPTIANALVELTTDEKYLSPLSIPAVTPKISDGGMGIRYHALGETDYQIVVFCKISETGERKAFCSFPTTLTIFQEDPEAFNILTGGISIKYMGDAYGPLQGEIHSMEVTNAVLVPTNILLPTPLPTIGGLANYSKSCVISDGSININQDYLQVNCYELSDGYFYNMVSRTIRQGNLSKSKNVILMNENIAIPCVYDYDYYKNGVITVHIETTITSESFSVKIYYKEDRTDITSIFSMPTTTNETQKNYLETEKSRSLEKMGGALSGLVGALGIFGSAMSGNVVGAITGGVSVVQGAVSRQAQLAREKEELSHPNISVRNSGTANAKVSFVGQGCAGLSFVSNPIENLQEFKNSIERYGFKNNMVYDKVTIKKGNFYKINELEIVGAFGQEIADALKADFARGVRFV